MASGAIALTFLLSLGESAAGGVVSKMASLATDQLGLKIVFSFSKELDQFRQSSTQIENLIHDAALEPEDQELRAIANWMKRLTTVAYAAEDVVDEVQYEAVRINIEGTILDKCIRRIFVRLQMAGKIDKINKSLEILHNEAPTVLLVTTRRSNGGAASSQGTQDRETDSSLEKHEFTSRDAKIFGRDEVVSDITTTLNNLSNQEMILLVMAVVGLPGVGKTTLARLLTKQVEQVKQLKEGEMRKYFDITLWVHVSKTFDVNSILRGMLESCEETAANSETRQGLIQRLRRKLKEKRYFLVLDDVWNENDIIWKNLKSCLRLLESAKGSTVIVTTRSVRVAEIMRTPTVPNCDLGILLDHQCWSIIRDRAFDDPNPSIDSDQERIGKEIARNCAGLPLAAKILGSLMHSKNSKDEWLKILQSPTWQLLRNHKDSEIMPVLKLSFDNLKSPLKPCFAYCSMLNRGSLIKREELIQLWMAQGFLNPSPHQRMQNREMEDIGNEYFDTLLEKSLFQDATKDKDGVITECKMHDFVHEFAIEVSRCESWTPAFNHEKDDSEIQDVARIPTPKLESMPDFNHEIRHVARIPTPQLESMSETSIARLRSLFSNVQDFNIIFLKLRALRVLSFYEDETQMLPNSLDKLKHLRYLDLSYTAIRELPKSIGKLYNLQTLRLPYLDKCPKEIQNLINLRHLYVDERMKFEDGILGRLTNLRTLRYFNVGLRRLDDVNVGEDIGLKFGYSLLLSVAGGAVGNVASLATDQLSLKIVFTFSKELDQLKQSSTHIENLIHDAALEPEDQARRAMADWMKRLMTVAYAAEDVVDELQYEAVRIYIEGTILNKDIRRIFIRLQMAGKIDNINKSLDNLSKQASSVGLTRRSNGGAVASQGMQVWETTSSEKNKVSRKDATIVGRDEVVSDIAATLTNPNNQQTMLLVMAIVGLPGGGKTTLARLLTKQLMKEGEMKKHFDITLWVDVSKTFDVKSILRGMLESCEATIANLETLQALIQSLRHKLKEKRYFLVLDDVWNEDPVIWKNLKSCLRQLESANGSTVIVTTRSAKVAEIMGTLPHCDLGILLDDECWSIIKDRAFDDPNPSIDSKQERIGREIANKCAGLPLAAKILGSLMHSKNSSDEWLKILQSPTWQNSIIKSPLMLSFDNLKSPLKPCFAYCSMLDKGSLIKREELIQLWMAQGFLNPSPHQRMQNREMEDIGNEYFDTLLEKSLFQDATKDKDDVITECKMHDLVHEFAIEVSRCESSTPDFNDEMGDSEIRHVARIPTPQLESMSETSIARLRSLFSNVQVSNIIFPKLRALRVLSFYEAGTQELPNSLDKLKHLRYLDLSHTAIRELPESIGKLYNLQTLRLPYLDKCPKEIQNLINLRHLYVDKRMKFKAGILGRLTNLRTLRYFNVGKEIGPAIEELCGLNQLRGHLIIDELEHVRDGEESKNARLVQKSHLHELTFKWTHGGQPNENQTDVLDGLEPHGELQRLNIENFMGARFPSWIMSLQNLKKIRLVGCNNCEGVPTLGHIPELRSLKISKMHKLIRVGAEFYGTGTTLFPALKILDISECEELIEWMEAPAEGEVVVFPCLKKLNISLCPKLGNAPSRFPCLKTLEIYETGNNVTIENISSQLTTLTRLDIYGVKGLTCLPEGMLKKNSSLTYLEIRDCDELTCIAPDVFGCCESLRSLIVTKCKKLSHLPDGLDKLPLLEQLRIEDCRSLKSIRITRGIASLRELNIKSCEGLSSLEVGLQYCTSLQELKISGCPNLMSIPITQCMPSLRTLEIDDCERLSSLGVLDYCTSLQKLMINFCHNLTSIPITEGITSLQRLEIVGCRRLLSLPSGLQFCTSLQDLEIKWCRSLVSISVSYHVCDHQDSTNQPEEVFTGLVQYLSIQEDCRSPESIPAHLRQSLICNCGKLKYEPTGFHSLTRLKKLTIGEFWKELDAFPDFQLPPPHDSQLEELQLDGWPKLKSLPQQIQRYTCLKTLWIHSFSGIEALPEWLGNLTSLETLVIWICGNLESLPTQDAMKSLTKLNRLSIYKCPLLEKRCTKETGPEWPKISHIPELGCSGRNMHAANLPSSTRNAENLTSSRRNAVLDCLPCCIL